MTPDLMTAAIRYARAGRAVLPCRPRAKEPMTAHGLHDATTDETSVRAWWSRWPDANVGIACGAPSAFFAVDVDVRNGGDETMRAILEEHGSLPETREAATGGGGWHFLFRWPDDAASLIWRGSLGAGVDLKSSGYIIVSPSIHPSGTAYAWANRAGLAEAPAWLLELATRPVYAAPLRRPLPATGRLERFVAAAVAGESAKVAQAPRGERNNTLNRAAFALGGLLSLGLRWEDAEAELLAAAHVCGLPAHEARRTIASGLSGGARRPRQVPERRAA